MAKMMLVDFQGQAVKSHASLLCSPGNCGIWCLQTTGNPHCLSSHVHCELLGNQESARPTGSPPVMTASRGLQVAYGGKPGDRCNPHVHHLPMPPHLPLSISRGETIPSLVHLPNLMQAALLGEPNPEQHRQGALENVVPRLSALR